jgi:alkanesulfonate monooxygenase SsuD/methylene tetrahydromethanopterin reductase-like flavin-dependent oxidoreductase (luciferase family)
MKPFRFGIVAGQAPDLGVWTALARRAEDLGYETLLSPDPQFDLDPFTTLAAAAGAAPTLRVGTFVAVDMFRDRRLLDWQARSLHAVTGRRFELGLGTGRPEAARTVERLGGRFGTARERFERLTETVAFLKQRPDRPPLLLAAGGPRMLSFAAREADTVTLAAMPRTTETEFKSIVDKFWPAAEGRDVELAMNLLAVGDEPAPWLERFTGVGVAELVAGGAVSVLPGTARQAADTLLRRREEFGVSYLTVNSGFLEQLAPVVELLRGS